MSKLLYKEFKLAAHPTTFIFMLLSFLLIIPNYPYYVTFFYMALGIFFISLTGRENHDIYYSMLLPIRKKDIVDARFAMIIIIEALQFIFAVPAALIRNYAFPMQNDVGIEANIAFFGLSLIMVGIFNLSFISSYYKNPEKVGKAFVLSSTYMFLCIVVFETFVHAVPFMRDCIDTKDPEFLGYKLIFLFGGLIVFAVLTLISYKKSVKSFLKYDLN